MEVQMFEMNLVFQNSASTKIEGLQFLEELTLIDSQTSHIEGVNLVQAMLAQKLTELGFDVSFLPNKESQTGDLLYAEKSGLSSERITFVGHADTVCSPGSALAFSVDFNKKEIRGAGVGDDKGSLVMALLSLEKFLLFNPTHYHTLTFISSPCEEMGSVGFHSLFRRVGLESSMVLGLEPALFNGSLISSRNGNRWYKINIQGKAAHAGRFGEPFVNAAHCASEFISKIHSLNEIHKKTKVNVGSIRSLTDKYNIICDHVEIKLDVRFPTLEVRDSLDQAIKSLLETSSVECFYTEQKCFFSLEIVDDCPPMDESESSHCIIETYRNILSQYEEGSCIAEHSGGAADINYFAHPGLITIDGLGPKTRGMHTVKEVMDLDSFYTRQYALCDLLNYLEKKKISLRGEDYEH